MNGLLWNTRWRTSALWLSDRLRPPAGLMTHFAVLIPLAISQVLQRLYHIIDNRYINVLGKDALLIHNIQYNFVVLGLSLGAATATSCLVFWRRQESQGKQGSILIRHLQFYGGLALTFAGVFALMSAHVVAHFQIPDSLAPLARIYFFLGIMNMVLHGLYGSLDGMLIASGQQKRSMIFASLLALGNWGADALAIHVLYQPGTPANGSIDTPLLFIGVSTLVLMAVMSLVAYRSVLRRIDGWERFPFKSIVQVWWAEAGLGVIRSITPIIYAYQLALVQASQGFLVTYQLALHVAYVFCLPLLAGTQLAVRDAAEAASKGGSTTGRQSWWNVLLYTALLPTSLLLLIGMLVPGLVLRAFYGYSTPRDHLYFLSVFYIACLLGQLGNILLVPLRAMKKNALVTRNMLIAETGVLLGGTQLLIWFNIAKPETICWITMVYSLTHLLLNAGSLGLLSGSRKESAPVEVVLR